MNPQIDAILLSQNAIVNKNTENITLFETFSQFQPGAFPFPTTFFVIVLIRGLFEPAKLTGEVTQANSASVNLGMALQPGLKRTGDTMAGLGVHLILQSAADVEIVVRLADIVYRRSFPVEPMMVPSAATSAPL